jgi:uncharacterized membrane protein YkoI
MVRGLTDLHSRSFHMQTHSKPSLARLATGAIIFAGLTALWATAALADLKDAKSLEEAKITLQEAITAVENEHGGQAMEAGIDDDSFSGPVFEVSLFKDGRLYDAQVDGKTGKVTGIREDRDD